jgi:hypothetical protein
MAKNAVPLFLLVALNLSFGLVVAFVGAIHFDVYAHHQDPIAVLVVIPADVVLVVLGLCLFALGQFRRVSVLDRVLPFVSIPVLTVPGLILSNTMSGSQYDWKPGYLIGAASAAVLIGFIVIGFVTSLRATVRKAH